MTATRHPFPARELAAAYAGLWLMTGASALLALGSLANELPAPPPSITAEPATAAGILANNARLLWPLALIALGWAQQHWPRRIANLALAAQLTVNAGLVGSAIGQHSPEIWLYLPHLPLEWLAFALAGAAWINAQRQPWPHARTATYALACLALLTAGAVIETYLVPTVPR